MIYLDNAATSFPKPEGVWQAMDRVLRSCGNPGRGGHALARKAEEEVGLVRVKVARFFGAPTSERVIFTLNATDSLNIALKGFLRPGDHVVSTRLEHNSVVRPLATLAGQGITHTEAACDGVGFVDPVAFEAAITAQTRLAVVNWVSNVVGTIQPVKALAGVCRRRGVRLLVDASQAAGHAPIDMRSSEIDMMACSGHKGLFGPTGVGLLILGEGIDLVPSREGGTGVGSQGPAQPEAYPYHLEAGTPNTVGIAGLGAGLDFLTSVGVEEIGRKVADLTACLRDGLEAVPGVILYGPRDPARQGGVISFNLEGWDPADVATVLDQSFGICCRPGLHCCPGAHRLIGTFPSGTVRLGPGYFNTRADAEAVVEAVRSMAP